MARNRQQKNSGKKSKPEKEEEESVEEEDVENEIESDEPDSNSDDDSSESGSESDGEEDVAAALFKGPKEDSESDDDSDGEDSIENNNATPLAPQSEAYTFDLRNMLAINTDQLAIGTLYDTKKSKDENKDIEIPLDPKHGTSLEVNEKYLLSKASDGCTELILSLWELPTEISDAGPLVTLPTYDEVRLPRALVRIFSIYYQSTRSCFFIITNIYLPHS